MHHISAYYKYATLESNNEAQFIRSHQRAGKWFWDKNKPRQQNYLWKILEHEDLSDA